MGILDGVTGTFDTGSSKTGGNQLVTALMALLASQGGIAALVQKFAGSGLGDIVNSWVSTGQNKGITPQQVQQGLGPDLITQLSERTGMGQEDVKSQLAQMLPQIIDKLTPKGQVPAQNDLMSKGMEMLKGLF